MQNPMIETWLQYNHLDQEYGYLPGMRPAHLAAILGMDERAYRGLIDQFDAQAQDAARTLLSDSRIDELADQLSLRENTVILGIGDSITSDRQSWLEILRHVLSLRRPANSIRVINAGLSAHTTAMVFRRWVPVLTAVRPQLVICCLGTNDVTRIGPEPTVTQVSLNETIRNLMELRRLARVLTASSWMWLTPPTVDEARAAAFPGFHQGLSTWRNDDLAAIARRIREFAEPIVDTQELFGQPARGEFLGPDGVHPSLAGQTAIAGAVIERLSVLNTGLDSQLVGPPGGTS